MKYENPASIKGSPIVGCRNVSAALSNTLSLQQAIVQAQKNDPWIQQSHHQQAALRLTLMSNSNNEYEQNHRLTQYFSQHPTIKALDQKIQASLSAKELARQKYKPEWGINASYGYRQTLLPQTQEQAEASLTAYTNATLDFKVEPGVDLSVFKEEMNIHFEFYVSEQREFITRRIHPMRPMAENDTQHGKHKHD